MAEFTVEIQETGVLLSGGESMPQGDAERMARIHTQKWPGRVVRILDARNRPVQVWRDGVCIS